MRQMFKTMEERLLAGEDLVLVTITASTGATPRGVGARMLVGRAGRICGTIGGGAVEYRAEQMALRALEEKTSDRHGFSLTRDDVENLGMICGGAVDVFFHYIPAGDRETLALAREAERLFAGGEALWLLSDIGHGGALSLYTEREGFLGRPCPDWIKTKLTRQPKHIQQDGEDYCVEQINSPGRVYIFGCGHVSQQLEPVLTRVGFRCVMLDDRPEFAARELFPTAEEVKCIDLRNIAESVTIGQEDYVCVMTRGHAHDTEVQAQVLRRHPCYVGVIGSKKKAAGVRKALAEIHGLTEEELDQVTTPIGLSIDAETPEEIAISIAAQMIQVRAQRSKTLG